MAIPRPAHSYSFASILLTYISGLELTPHCGAQCHHGGHVGHLQHWFASNSICPVRTLAMWGRVDA
eukprot:3266814-Rhodomonas_salina.2